MIRHLVMWKMKHEAEGADAAQNAATMKRMIDSLAGRIPQLKSLECGVNQKPSDRAFDFALVTLFESWDDLETYQNHPEHRKVVAFVRRVTERSIAVDYELPD